LPKLRGGCEARQARIAINALDKRLAQLRDMPERIAKIRMLRSAVEANTL
jgi:hypothetical protein